MSVRPTIADLLAEPARGRSLDPEDAAELLIALAPVQRALELAVATRPAAPTEPRLEQAAPRLLTMAEAAERARKSVRWLRDHWRTELPFAVKKGRSLLFPEVEFERWLRRS